MVSRGLVVLPDHEFKNGKLEIQGLGAKYDIPRIRRNLLYWDKLDFPANPIVTSALPKEAQFLVDEGVLMQSPAPRWKSGQVTGDVWANANLEVWRAHEAEEPRQWSMGQKSPYWSLPIREQADTAVALVELHGVLPQPAEDEPLEAVYEFKTKRKAELHAFRIYMDRLYLDIINSNDIPRTNTAVIDSLETSLKDLNRVANETWGQRLMRSGSLEISLGGLIAGAAAGVGSGALLASYFVGLATGLGTTVLSGLKFSITKETFFPKLPEHLKDFAYLYKPEKD